jgi:small subunit ribosomal protein S17
MMTTVTVQATHTVTGRVISNKMEKTIVVEVVRKVPSPLYRKYVKQITKLFAHDEAGRCKIGDTVVIKQCRPLSKKKTWMLVDVLETANV